MPSTESIHCNWVMLSFQMVSHLICNSQCHSEKEHILILSFHMRLASEWVFFSTGDADMDYLFLCETVKQNLGAYCCIFLPFFCPPGLLICKRCC